MSTSTQIQHKPEIIYPESDGQPMAENTLQFRWIVTIQGGLDALYSNDPNVFVAGDLFWYPVEGNNTIRTAPDVMVAFGRGKGDRGAYLQWLENDIAPQVVFEVISPGNRFEEMLQKFRFYERYGVEEYYTYDPDRGELAGWRRVGGELQEIPNMNGWVSPRLGIRFELVNGELRIYGPANQPLATYVELAQQRERERERADRLADQLKRLGFEPEQ